MPDETPAAVKAADRVEELTDQQRSRLLFRLCARVPDAINTAIDDFERTSWRWGE